MKLKALLSLMFCLALATSLSGCTVSQIVPNKPKLKALTILRMKMKKKRLLRNLKSQPLNQSASGRTFRMTILVLR